MKRYLKTPEEVIDVLKEGKKVQTDYMVYWFEKGVFFSLNKKDHYVCINSNIFFKHDCMYTDEPEPLKLEVGKFYKTRAGRKVWITYAIKDEHEYYPFCCIVLGGNEVYYVNEQGFVVSTETSELDLVAPWEE